MSGFKRYFRNTSWLLSEKIIRMAVNLIMLSIISRYLGVENFGVYNYVLSFTSIFIALSTLGLDSIVVKYIINHPDKKLKIFGTSFVLKLIGAITCILIVISTIAIAEVNNNIKYYIVVVISITIVQSLNVIDYYYQSQVKSKYMSVVSLITLMLSSIIKLYLITYDYKLESLFYAYVIEGIVLAILQVCIFLHHKNSIMSWRFDFSIAKDLLYESLPLVFAGLLNSVYMKIDTIMIGHYQGYSDVGLYSAAVRLSEVWFSIGVIICNSLFPAILNSRENRELYYARLLALFKMLVLISVCLSVFTSLFSNYIIEIIYGKEFLAASSVLVIHIFSSIFVYLGVSSGRWLISEGKTYLSFQRNLLALLVNVLLNIIFIPIYGIIGAAYTSLFSYIVAFYLFDMIKIETRPLFILKTKAMFFPFDVFLVKNLKRLR